MSQGMTPEFAEGYRWMMLDGIKREAEITKKVLAAVPDANLITNLTSTPALAGTSRGIWPTPMSNFSMRLPI